MGTGRIHFASITTAAAWAEREGKKSQTASKEGFYKKRSEDKNSPK